MKILNSTLIHTSEPSHTNIKIMSKNTNSMQYMMTDMIPRMMMKWSGNGAGNDGYLQCPKVRRWWLLQLLTRKGRGAGRVHDGWLSRGKGSEKSREREGSGIAAGGYWSPAMTKEGREVASREGREKRKGREGDGEERKGMREKGVTGEEVRWCYCQQLGQVGEVVGA